MEKRGSIIHNLQKFDYEIDEQGFIWIKMKMGKTNIGQINPITPHTDIERVVHEMLDGGGY